MPWFRVDDKFGDHPKVRRLGKDLVPAVGLWTLCGTWCSDNVTTTTLDGFVPESVVRRYDPRLRLARRLVAVGLWCETHHEGELGFRFHQWEERQPTREEVEEKRAANTAKVAAWRDRNAGSKGAKGSGNPVGNPVTSQVGNPVSNPAPIPEPVPSSPNGEGPSLRSGTRAKRSTATDRATTVPLDFAVTPEMVDWARRETPLVDGRRATEAFVDHWRQATKNHRKRDWVAAWRNWMRKAQDDVEDRRPRGARQGGVPQPGPTGSRRMDKVLSALDPDDPFLAQYVDQVPEHGHLTAIEGGLIA